jgi:phage repressor protein C with HTH and peptisase S24 domain
MLTHARVWAAIDSLAERYGLSPSGLAKRAGLDPTSFNKSKRRSADGRLRWPSTESLSKIISATGASFDEFVALVESGATDGIPVNRRPHTVPLLGFAKAGAGGFFDDAGFPAGVGWDSVEVPSAGKSGSYALEVQGDSMLPLYRKGDMLIVDPSAALRRGDRVVVRTRGGEVMAKILQRKTANYVELLSLNPEHALRKIEIAELDWISRVIWASQ